MKEFRVDLKSLIVEANTEDEARDKVLDKLEKGFKIPDLLIRDIEELDDSF